MYIITPYAKKGSAMEHHSTTPNKFYLCDLCALRTYLALRFLCLKSGERAKSIGERPPLNALPIMENKSNML